MELMDRIEQEVKVKFKSWKEFETASGIPARHGKRRMQFYILRLNNLLKLMGLKITLKKL